jgi:polyisoprenoid-binding protein YceI
MGQPDAPTGAAEPSIEWETQMIKTRFAVLGMMALMTGTAATAAAQETARVAVSPDSKLWIDGTSNLHAWTCKAEKMDAAIDLDAAAAAQLASAPPKALKRVRVKVPIKSLKCGHGAMDDNLYKALNADGSPDISYILATFEAAPSDKDTFTLHTIGTLTIAGKENKISMDVEATRLADGTVKAKGMLPIKMTDYGIKPPTAIFGRLKTGDEVKINFELTIGGKAIAAALGQP